MQKRSVRQGRSSFFFHHPPHGLVADALDVAELDEAAGEQPHRPPRLPGGRRAAGDRQQVRLGAAVEHHLPPRVGLRLVAHRRERPLERRPLARPLHGREPDPERLGDLHVGLALVDAEQKACPRDVTHGGAATAAHRLELVAFVGREAGEVALRGHASGWRPRRPRATLLPVALSVAGY